MKTRYSKWLEENVFDMTEAQEKFLVQNGFEIVKPELKEHDDKKVRDIPHYINPNKDKPAYIQFDRKTGKFELIVKSHTYKAEEIDTLIEEAERAKELISILHAL